MTPEDFLEQLRFEAALSAETEHRERAQREARARLFRAQERERLRLPETTFYRVNHSRHPGGFRPLPGPEARS